MVNVRMAGHREGQSSRRRDRTGQLTNTNTAQQASVPVGVVIKILNIFLRLFCLRNCVQGCIILTSN